MRYGLPVFVERESRKDGLNQLFLVYLPRDGENGDGWLEKIQDPHFNFTESVGYHVFTRTPLEAGIRKNVGFGRFSREQGLYYRAAGCQRSNMLEEDSKYRGEGTTPNVHE